jgi:5-methyltetrahydropteroyltriglutamate--homocysteine methyltransferase
VTALPIMPVTMVGSWPRPRELLRAQKLRRAGRLGEDELQREADRSVLEVLRLQELAGVDMVTDGEQRRDGFFSFVADKLEGVQMMTLAEMLEIVENKAAFERILQTLDVPAFSISNATCVGRIARRRSLAADEVRFVRRHTSRPIKVPLPGPYLMTRAMWVKEASRAAYPSKEELGEDVVNVLRDEVRELVELGVDFIQFDEPVLTELVFTQGQARTFMCAALAARKDPAEELELAVHLVNRVVAGFDRVRIGLHICRGNWSRDETTLLSGSYQPLKPYLERMQIRQFVLEYATERAGELVELSAPELGLGVVNPRTEVVERVDDVKRVIERALKLYRPERLFVNPDCGFATFSNRPVNSSEIAVNKMKTISEAVKAFR